MVAAPRLSILIGVYNGGTELRPSLESVLSQRDADMEIIVVDDGSTDDTAAQLQVMKREDARLRVLTQTNGGLTSALIRGCRAARGKYIARHDIGDRSLPGRFHRQAALLDADPSVAMVTCGYRFVGPRDEILSETMPQYTAMKWTQILRSGDETLLHGPHHGSVMFRKAAYEAVGGYRPEFYFTQDLDLWTRLVVAGTLDYVPEILYEVGFTYESISARFDAQQHQLKRLIALATQRRNRGESESDLMRQVAAIGKPATESGISQESRANADYFIGSCLAARKDPAARRYFRQVLSKRPLHARTWAKLLRSYVTWSGGGG